MLRDFVASGWVVVGTITMIAGTYLSKADPATLCALIGTQAVIVGLVWRQS